MNTQVTVIPQLTEVNFASNVDLLAKFTNYLDFVSDFTKQIEVYMQYDQAQYQGDFVTAETNTFTTIDSKKAELDPEFLAYYIKEYNRLVDAVKVEIQAKTSNTTGLYSNLSDSIGVLANINSIFTDSVVPVNDLDANIYPLSQPYPATLVNKLSPTAKSIAASMNKSVTTLYRHNIVNIQSTYATSSEAHGSNLITDINAYLRARQMIPALVSKLHSDFADLFTLVSFYCNLNDYSGYNPQDPTLNLQEIGRLKYTEVVEGTQVELDLLGKRIVSARKDVTLKQKLAATSDYSTAGVTVVPVQSGASARITPINSTAVSTSTATTEVQAPQPVTRSANEESNNKSIVTNAAQKKASTPSINLLKGLNINILKLPAAIPEFSRALFASATNSPIAAINAIKNLLCTIKLPNFSFQSLGKITLPKLPNFHTSFHYKNPFTGLAQQVQQALVKKLKSLIPPIPKIPDLKKIFTEYAKKLCSCNPGNKK